SHFGRGVFKVLYVNAAVQSTSGVVVNGARDTANNFTSDGVAVNDIISSRQMPNGFVMGVDSFREIKIQTANNSAEFPQVAQFIAISRAGENRMHGNLYWGNFNSIFSARNFFDRCPPSCKTSFTNFNMFAGGLGGPVRLPKQVFGPFGYDGRDKTFFFFDYGGGRFRQGNRNLASVPTSAFRNGDFSAIAGNVTIIDPETGQPFPGNKIPANRISPVSQALQGLLYPDPNRVHTALGDFGINANYIIDPGYQFNSDVYSIRVDQKVSNSNTMFVRVGLTKSNQDVIHGALKNERDGGFFGNVPGKTVILSDTQTFSPKLINEFRAGYNWLQYRNSNMILGEDIVGQIGLQGLSNPKDEVILKSMPGLGFARFSGSAGANFNKSGQHTYQVTDNLTWLRGRHSLKVGSDIRRYQINDFSRPSNERGSFSFDDRLSGFDYANFLLGLPSGVSFSIPRPGAYLRGTQYALYFQDDLKLSQKLTLNYGVRYEYQTPWADKFDRRFSFDRKTGSLVTAGDKIPTDLVPQLAATLPIITAPQAGLPARSLVEADRNNWNPRLGIAYRPFADATTVIRMGYGWYTSMFPGLLAFRGTGGPWQTNYSLSLIGDRPTMRFPNPFLGNPGFGGVTNISVVNPIFPAERSQQWNLSIGRELWGAAIDVAYVGTKTTNIPFTNNLNLLPPSTTPYDPARRAYPRFNTVAVLEAGGQAIYHGLTIQADRKMARGLYFNANYAYAKAMTDVALNGYEIGFQQNQYNRRLERAADSSVRKHQLRFSYIYELPIGRGKALFSEMPRVANAVLGGWQFNGITTILSGPRISPSFSGVDPTNTNQFSGRPDRIGNGNIGDIQDRIKAGLPIWDRGAFVVPQAGRGFYGNSARTVLVGPGSHVWNAGLSKNFMLTETARFQFRWELFNAFNQVNFGSGSTNITSGSFGLTTGAGAGRRMIFAARIDF
ncbi:MAG: TonB-dependent receptor domain-containing protein, partial [Blastocatellia bacterium]